MNFVLRGQFELESDWIDLLLDGKGANVSGSELLTGQAQPDVTCGQPDLLSSLVRRGVGSSKVCCHLAPAPGSLKMMVCFVPDPLALSEPVIYCRNIRGFPVPGEQGWLETEHALEGSESS